LHALGGVERLSCCTFRILRRPIRHVGLAGLSKVTDPNLEGSNDATV
jgi:hypothetical protein